MVVVVVVVVSSETDTDGGVGGRLIGFFGGFSSIFSFGRPLSCSPASSGCPCWMPSLPEGMAERFIGRSSHEGEWVCGTISEVFGEDLPPPPSPESGLSSPRESSALVVSGGKGGPGGGIPSVVGVGRVGHGSGRIESGVTRCSPSSTTEVEVVVMGGGGKTACRLLLPPLSWILVRRPWVVAGITGAGVVDPPPPPRVG